MARPSSSASTPTSNRPVANRRVSKSKVCKSKVGAVRFTSPPTFRPSTSHPQQPLTRDRLRPEVSGRCPRNRPDATPRGQAQPRHGHQPLRQLLPAHEPTFHRGDRECGSNERNTRPRHGRLNFGLSQGNAEPVFPSVLLRTDGRTVRSECGIALFYFN